MGLDPWESEVRARPRPPGADEPRSTREWPRLTLNAVVSTTCSAWVAVTSASIERPIVKSVIVRAPRKLAVMFRATMGLIERAGVRTYVFLLGAPSGATNWIWPPTVPSFGPTK